MAKGTLHDSEAMRRFAGIKLGYDRTPVETTILNFRHLLQRHAPPVTKNKARARDPEMCSNKKGRDWYFGIKAHIGQVCGPKRRKSAVKSPHYAAKCD